MRFVKHFMILALVIGMFAQISIAQNERLSLAEILTGLQERRSGASLSVKNNFIARRVRQRGVTFPMSSEIRAELVRAGASTPLINAIQAAAPRNTPTRVGNPDDIAFDKLWVTYDVTENGKKGMRVHTKFSVKSMKSVPLELRFRFQKQEDGGGILMAKAASTYKNRGGQLAVVRKLRPNFDPAYFNDISAFIPYSEFVLPNGKHNLAVDADITYPDGTLLKHLELHPFQFTRGATPSAPSAKFYKMTFDHNVRQDGKLGMQINLEATVSNLLGKNIQFVIGFEKPDGTRIMGQTQAYRSKSGYLAVYQKSVPKFKNAKYSNLKFFVPYSEFGPQRPPYNFKAHADVLHPVNGEWKDVHIAYQNFTIPRMGGTTNAAPKVTLENLRIQHNIRVGGRRGMGVEVDFVVANLANQQIRPLCQCGKTQWCND